MEQRYHLEAARRILEDAVPEVDGWRKPSCRSACSASLSSTREVKVPARLADRRDGDRKNGDLRDGDGKEGDGDRALSVQEKLGRREEGERRADTRGIKSVSERIPRSRIGSLAEYSMRAGDRPGEGGLRGLPASAGVRSNLGGGGPSLRGDAGSRTDSGRQTQAHIHGELHKSGEEHGVPSTYRSGSSFDESENRLIERNTDHELAKVDTYSDDLRKGAAHAYTGDTHTYDGDTCTYTADTHTYSGDTRTYTGDTRTHTGEGRTYSGETFVYPGNTRSYSQESAAEARLYENDDAHPYTQASAFTYTHNKHADTGDRVSDDKICTQPPLPHPPLTQSQVPLTQLQVPLTQVPLTQVPLTQPCTQPSGRKKPILPTLDLANPNLPGSAWLGGAHTQGDIYDDFDSTDRRHDS